MEKGDVMTAMDKLQYYSPGRWIYYWFGEAFGVLIPHKAGDATLRYLGKEAEIKRALITGTQLADQVGNLILQRELAAAPEYYRRIQQEHKGEKQGEFTGLSD
jgi:hypothetical protein